MPRRFAQVDVFGSAPPSGNPVSVVLDAEGLTDDEMQRFANWTNLSETTFVLAPTSADADYRVRIFTPTLELPFAGHPTLGTCHAWLQAGNSPRTPDEIVQECAIGLVRVRRSEPGLAFEAPQRSRSGPVADDVLRDACAALGIAPGEVVEARWCDNGPPWIGLLLRDAEAVMALSPSLSPLDIGVIGPCPPGESEAFEIRTFFPNGKILVEDPITGSFQAAAAQWLIGEGHATAPYVARQGTALGRLGRVHISTDAEGTVWVAGATHTMMAGTVEAVAPGGDVRGA